MNTPPETAPKTTPAPDPDFSALFEPAPPASDPARADRRAALQAEAQTDHPHGALTANYLLSFPKWLQGKANAPDLKRALKTADRVALFAACLDRLAGKSWTSALAAHGSDWLFLMEARRKCPTFGEIYDRINDAIRARRIEDIETAISHEAAGEPLPKGRRSPDTAAAKLYLSANDPRYKPGQSETAPVVNIQINL